MFHIHFLPAEHGDCIWIEYGDASSPHRILIDGGPGYRHSFGVLKGKLGQLSPAERAFELLILTHIDADHIGGAIKLLEDEQANFKVSEIWFNGWRHIQPFLFADNRHGPTTFSPDAFGRHIASRPRSPRGFLGAKQGEMFSTILRDRQIPWNQCFDGHGIFVDRKEDEVHLPRIELPGGMVLTVLSPDATRLKALAKRWDAEIRKLAKAKDLDLQPGDDDQFRQFLGDTDFLGSRKSRTTSTNVDELADTPFEPDSTPPNGSSIAVLAEFDGKRALLTGDAHTDVLEASLRSLQGSSRRKLQIDVMKLSHHGSKHNTSNELLKLIDCPRYVVCSNGNQFNHPDNEAIGRVLHQAPDAARLYFNYRSDENGVWNDRTLRQKYSYRAHYPRSGENGVVVKL